jgi:Bacterial mobilisation protein (MobC)
MSTPAGCQRFARLDRLAKGGSIPALETPSKTAPTQVLLMPKASSQSLVRTKMLQVRFSPIEYEMIRSKALDTGLSLGELTRRCMLLRPIPTPPPRLGRVTLDTYLELSRIGNNINQLAKVTNTAIKMQLPPPASPELLQELLELLRHCQREIANTFIEESDEETDDWQPD